MRKKKEPYFGEVEEQAVVDYIRTDSAHKKNKIYNEILRKPFTMMIESILRRYPTFIGNYEMEELEFYALAHLIEHMVKFDPDRITKSGNKTKAFSYCQTIVRNYFKDHSKKSYVDKKTNLFYDDYVDEFNNDSTFLYEMEDDEEHLFLDKLINDVICEIQNKIINDGLKEIEIVVGDAIINILKNWDILFMEESNGGKINKKSTNKFAKNKILLFLKEQTRLSTKDIRLGIKPFKDIYFLQKENNLKLI
jgi:hypothetical protein